ncbi:hypothetical protein [Laspinema palackyanum]|uniref:hypothetical protein n=1 Tax=Laspinema palackyanum TaxID=3231601 RepID=UPI00345D18F0|nr:hypothetical protein [Laspinema sp. D2c]
MNHRTDPYNRKTSQEEQLLYDHLLDLVKAEPPSEMISRFQSLFIEARDYPEAEISGALGRMLTYKGMDQDFKFILNRCCHILVNRWQMHSQTQEAIPELVALFERPGGYNPYGRSRTGRQLQELVKDFTSTDQYLTLRRLSKVVQHSSEISQPKEQHRPLGTFIDRYPYLYSHCLLSEDSSYEHQQTVRKIQAQRQRQFEINLSQYVTYQVRRSQVRRTGNVNAVRNLSPIANPTLLSDRELYYSLKDYVGKAEGGRTYRDLAQSFITHTSQSPNYGEFKADLYDYLLGSIDPEYGKRQFNDKLCKHLKATLPQSDSQKLSDFLVVRTCSQLLNFLVVESSQKPSHFIFLDVVSNIGPTRTTGMLLKIVLLCRKVKPYLEKRLSILFNHYENSNNDSIIWLIKMLENINVALSTNFGALDLSFMSQIA